VPRASENENRPTPQRVFLWRSAFIGAALTLTAFACGPSVQSIYEGNVRFEHCYRLDLEVDTAPTHRQACWTEWLSMYTYGQPRDRIEYARRRVHAFASGDVDRPTLDIGDAKKTEARQFYLVVPAPTSVHAPPPPIATRWYGDAGAAPAAPIVPTAAASASLSAPNDKCSSDCRETHAACAAPCDPDAGKPDPPCKACDPDYKNCMKRCFQ
jgi:hypothetical protein